MCSPYFPHRRNLNFPGHAHELTFSCFQRIPLLRAERTCRWLAESITTASADLDFATWAFVFMPEHVHLIIHPRPAEYDLSRIRQRIKEPIARQAIEYLKIHAPEWLPRLALPQGKRTRHHFWQKGGGYDRNITDPKTLGVMIEYLHLNPVRRGFVNQSRGWKWSSAAWFEGSGPSPVKLDPIPPEWTVSA